MITFSVILYWPSAISLITTLKPWQTLNLAELFSLKTTLFSNVLRRKTSEQIKVFLFNTLKTKTKTPKCKKTLTCKNVQRIS